MKVVSKAVYIGPNLYALFPVIRLVVQLGELEQHSSTRLGTGFTDAIRSALPGLAEHGCSYREPGGFLRRLTEDEGTWMGHVLEHLALELQNMAGGRVSFGRTRGTGVEGEYEVVYAYEQEDVGLEAGRLGLDLILNNLPAELRPPGLGDTEFDFAEERDAFIRFAQRRALGPSTASLVRAAEQRDIPYLRLNRYSLVQFGHGRYGRRIQATITGETRHIAVELASDKEETNQMLGDLGLPVARQRLVYSSREAVRAAERIGFPVVVKPLNANHGRGVSIHLCDADAVATAYDHARGHSRTVLVESFIEGLDHRLLVIDGKLVAASKRVPGHVVGDGERTVEELLELVNQDPRRGIGHEKVLTQLELDHQALRLLELKGFSVESVPPAGETLYLRSTGNLSTGGTAVDVTDTIHPDNREMAERAARAIGLDVCGVDFLTTDITESYRVRGGAICEVNAAPGFRMHVAPSEGTPRDVAGPVMDMLFPPGQPSRIPIASITGTNGKTTTARMVAHVFKLAGSHVGLATTDAVYIDGHKSVEGDMTGPVAARMILRDPSVDVAVLETARGGMLKRGMGYRRCNVGAVLNVQADHLGLRGVETLEDLARVKRIVVEVAKDAAVLNADDEHCLLMASYTEAKQLCYVTMNPAHPLVREHILAGGRAVVLEEGMAGHMITLYDSGSHIPLLWTHLVPATLEGRAMHNVQNAMFAAAITFCMGVKLDEIRHGLRTFDTTWFQAPGRMNVCDEHPFKVILDYGHNPAAVTAMVELADALEPEGKRVVVLAAPGDRRDEDIAAIATACAGHFDRYLCRRDDQLRGRAPDEVPRMQCEALLAAGVDEAAIEVIPDEVEAVNRALELGEPGDLLLVFGDDIRRSWEQITGFSSGGTRVAGGSPTGSAARSPRPLPETAFGVGEELVRDERGVRLPRREEPSD
ncbi:MAG: cyanophycin synthetase [Planctomycetes bacterium]|jgi:cyanophycin synthetase|nr:cyanophycin synthetase [Planctomycetota bacterium]MDP6410469.1 cyanophycin synthetase [Planctomycetota bacterium]